MALRILPPRGHRPQEAVQRRGSGGSNEAPRPPRLRQRFRSRTGGRQEGRLEEYTRDLTEAAAQRQAGPRHRPGEGDPAGHPDPVRRTENNPVLHRSPGVGKTAIPEGLPSASRRCRRAGGAAGQAGPVDICPAWSAGTIPGRVEEPRQNAVDEEKRPATSSFSSTSCAPSWRRLHRGCHGRRQHSRGPSVPRRDRW